MENTDAAGNQIDDYTARIIIAAITNCENEEQAAKLCAVNEVLYSQIDQVVEQTGALMDGDQDERAIAMLDAMIGKAKQLTQPFPTEAVREVCSYGMVRLYFQRAIVRFSGGASNFRTALADLDIAQGYPTSTFAELDPEVLEGMGKLRAIIEAYFETEEVSEAKQGMPQASGAGVNLSTALWWGALFGLGVVLGSLLLSWIFGEGAITILVVPLLALALLFGVNRWALGRRLPFRLSPIFKLYLMGVVLGIVARLMQQGLGDVLTAPLTVMIAAIGFWLGEARTPFLADFN